VLWSFWKVFLVTTVISIVVKEDESMNRFAGRAVRKISCRLLRYIRQIIQNFISDASQLGDLDVLDAMLFQNVIEECLGYCQRKSSEDTEKYLQVQTRSRPSPSIQLAHPQKEESSNTQRKRSLQKGFGLVDRLVLVVSFFPMGLEGRSL
jgi:hypothetical protein